jgi:hypothetical protein
MSCRVFFFGLVFASAMAMHVQGQGAAELYARIHLDVRFGFWMLGASLGIKYLFYRHVVRNINRAITCLLTVGMLTMLMGGLVITAESDSYLLPTPITWISSFITLSGKGMIGHPIAPLLFAMVIEPILLFVIFHPSRSRRVWILIPAANLFSVLIERLLFVLFEWIA